MKHIKKKFIHQYDSSDFYIDQNQFEIFEDNKNIGFSKAFLKKKSNIIVFTETTEKQFIGGFKLIINGTHYSFPVPDPTLTHFHSAQSSYRQSLIYKKELLKESDLSKKSNRLPAHEIYDFYGANCSTIINLFTTLECFNNQLIPESYIYQNKKNKFTETYNYNQVLEFIDFKTKATSIIPEIMKKNFFNDNGSDGSIIWTLKEFRDKIIHTKPDEKDLFKYKDIIKNMFNFKYSKSIEAVANYCNYYKKGCIEECDCDKKF